MTTTHAPPNPSSSPSPSGRRNAVARGSATEHGRLPTRMVLGAGLLVGLSFMTALTLVMAHQQREDNDSMFVERMQEIRHLFREAENSAPGRRLSLTEEAAKQAELFWGHYPENPKADPLRRTAFLYRGEARWREAESKGRGAETAGLLEGALTDFLGAANLRATDSESDRRRLRAWFGEGRVRARQGDYEGALRAFDRVLSANASYGAAYAWRGWVHRQCGEPEKAAADEANARRLGHHLAPPAPETEMRTTAGEFP